MKPATTGLKGSLTLQFVDFAADRLQVPLDGELRGLLAQYGILPFAAGLIGATYLAGSLLIWAIPDDWNSKQPATQVLQNLAPLWFVPLFMPIVAALAMALLAHLCALTDGPSIRQRLANVVSLGIFASSLPRLDIVVTFGLPLVMIAGLVITARLVYVRFMKSAQNDDDA